MIYIT